MLSVLIEAGEDAMELAASLASLVPGAVDGLVREVVVVDRGIGSDVREVADHAGCGIHAGDLKSLIGQAKGEWLLLMESGARLCPGWIEAVLQHLSDVAEGRASPAAAGFAEARRDRTPFLRRIAGRRSALRQGVVLPKTQAALRSGETRLEDLAKGLALRRLAAEIRPRPDPASR